MNYFEYIFVKQKKNKELFNKLTIMIKFKRFNGEEDIYTMNMLSITNSMLSEKTLEEWCDMLMTTHPLFNIYKSFEIIKK